MTYKSVCISSGHSTQCQGAVGYLNEVTEATRVADRLGEELRARGVDCKVYHDTISNDQDENLNRLADWHNSQTRDVDISVHFNASNGQGHGCEVWYYSQEELAADLSAAIATAGFTDRGEKYSSSLFILTHTEMPCVLLEICFVDNQGDANLYKRDGTFDTLCSAMADVLGGPLAAGGRPPRPERPPVEPPETESAFSFSARGTCSWFGGPDDLTGVSDDEDLAFIYDVSDAPHLFLPDDTPGTEGMGLARKLNGIAVNYVACRWPYDASTKAAWREALLENMALVRNVATGRETLAFPADWGPHEEQTGRAADLSQALMRDLKLVTDDLVEVQFPAPDPEED